LYIDLHVYLVEVGMLILKLYRTQREREWRVLETFPQLSLWTV
jgi:hypothetical protein